MYVHLYWLNKKILYIQHPYKYVQYKYDTIRGHPIFVFQITYYLTHNLLKQQIFYKHFYQGVAFTRSNNYIGPSLAIFAHCFKLSAQKFLTLNFD